MQVQPFASLVRFPDAGTPRFLINRQKVGEDLGLSYAQTQSLLFKALTKMRKPHVAQALQDYLVDSEDDL